MISSILSRLVILVFGTLYPAYASYKAVKSKNVKEYVKWMMYWIVFALFTCVETITDVFLSWFPFYYEIKIIMVIWLLSPATKGSSFLYRKFVHPMLSSREQEIDEYISKAREQSYKQVLDLGSKGVNVLMQTALKSGGGLVNQIKKSYSLSDLSDHRVREEGADETDVMITDPRLLRKRQSPRRTPSTSMYFSEIDVRTDAIVSVQSAEDLSSGYSSGEALTHPIKGREGLVRTASIGGNRARPTRVTRSTAVPKKSATTDANSELELEESKSIIAQADSSSDEDFKDMEEMVPKAGNLIDSTIETEGGDDDDDGGVDVAKADERSGRYHKRAAPEPPTIKATLVLKPGVVKPTNTGIAVFCHSPKLKRRKSVSRSPQVQRKSLKETLLMLPRRMGLQIKSKSQTDVARSDESS